MPKKTDETKRIPLRINLSLCKRVDAFRARWERSALGVQLSRNAAINMLLERGLAADKDGAR